MSPWNDRNRSMWLLYTGLVLAVVGLVTGYLRFVGVIDRDHDDGPGDPPTHVSTPSSTPSSTPTRDHTDPPPAPLEVVAWGRSSGQLAIVVRNDSGRDLDRVRVRITGRDPGGDPVLTTAGTPRDVCCTVVGLPPDGEFGLFAELEPGVGPIAAVEVTPLAIQDSPAGNTPQVTVRDPRLMREYDDTVATAVVVGRGQLSGHMAVAAFLTDAQGEVAQVISGRFYCFEPGRPREVRLHLFHAVPRSLSLDRIVAHAVPSGVPPHVPGRCD